MLNHKNTVWVPKLDFVEGAYFDSGFGVGLQLGEELALVLILLLSVCDFIVGIGLVQKILQEAI